MGTISSSPIHQAAGLELVAQMRWQQIVLSSWCARAHTWTAHILPRQHQSARPSSELSEDRTVPITGEHLARTAEHIVV